MSAGTTAARDGFLGTLALTATAALWGSNHVVARAVHEMVPLPALIFWRWLIGAGLLTAIAVPALRQAWPAIAPRLRELCFGGAVGVGLFSYFLIGGAYHSLALEVGFINATTPVWVALLGKRMGEGRVPGRTWAALALAFAGTLLIISKGQPGDLLRFHFNVGNLWSLLGAMTFAWFSIRIRGWTRVIDPLPLTIVTAWAGVIAVLLPVYLVWLATGGPWFYWHDREATAAIAAIAYIAVGPTMFGNALYLYGIASKGPARAAAFLYLTPAFSALLAIVWLKEVPAWFHFAGFIAIVGGLMLLQTGRPKAQP